MILVVAMIMIGWLAWSIYKDERRAQDTECKRLATLRRIRKESQMRMSREEYKEWRQDLVEIEITGIRGQSEKALFIEIDGDEFPVGKSVIDNIDELLEGPIPIHEPPEDLHIMVPRWCAHDNGWLDEEE